MLGVSKCAQDIDCLGLDRSGKESPRLMLPSLHPRIHLIDQRRNNVLLALVQSSASLSHRQRTIGQVDLDQIPLDSCHSDLKNFGFDDENERVRDRARKRVKSIKRAVLD